MQVSAAIEVRVGSQGQDRAAIFPTPHGAVLVLADGAGGAGHGGKAADAAIDQARALAEGRHESVQAAFLAIEAAAFSTGGLTTVVIACISNGNVHGASVGDSIGWLVSLESVIDLTEGQERKPLVGDGAVPREFGPTPLKGRLLLASDGLVKYAAYKQIIQTAMVGSIATAASALVRLPEFAGGRLQDDVAVVLVEADAEQAAPQLGR